MDFKKKAKIETDDFWYDLFDGVYIKLEDVLDNENDVINVKNAMRILRTFKKEAEDKKIIHYS